MNPWIELLQRLPAAADIASLFFLAPAAYFLWFGRHKTRSKDVQWATAGLLALFFLHTLGNVLERRQITDALDYSGLLLDVLFFFTLFAFSQHQTACELQAGEQQLRAANQQLQAGEQQLRASLQQLEASEQQLQAANQMYRNREELLSSIFRAAPTGIGMVVNRAFQQVNERLCEMTGYRREELLGQNARMLYPTQQEYDYVGTEKYRQIRDQGTGTVETRWQSKDGSIIDVLLSSTPLDAEDLSKGVTFTALDITERNQAVEALRENRRQLATLMSNLPGMAYRCKNDPDWTMEFVSEGCYSLTGFTSEELIHNVRSSYADLIHPQERRMVWETVQRGVQEKKSFQMIYRIKTAQEQEKWVWEQGQGVFGKDDNLLALEGFIADITERKQTEQALMITQFSMDHASDAAYWVGPDARFIYVNEAACKMLGYSKEELLRMTVHDIDPSFSPGIWPRHWEELSQKQVLRFESRHKTRDGNFFPVELTASFMEFGGKQYNCAFARDITERKRAEQEREKLLKALAAKNEELESIIYVSSHDLRSPLINIEGFAGELKHSIDHLRLAVQNPSDKAAIIPEIERTLNEEIPESLHFITAGVRKMTALLDGLLRLCRLGRLPLEIQRIDGHAIFRTILDTMQYQIEQVQASVTLDSNIPPCLADPHQLNQVFTNLLDNAVKYRHPERPCRIHISGRIEDGRTIYQITDNGKGIAPEYQQKIFEVFHRLNPNDSTAGEGLGLTIVKRLLDRLGGAISLDSKPGQGTTFYVTLPAA